ncbi:MAG TPA: hypothetical protein VF771_14485, partial [Longimicrobiaceae bacterium]
TGRPLSTHLRASREAVLAAAESAYVAMGIPIGTRDPANGQVGNRAFQPGRRLNGLPVTRFFYCGNAGLGAEITDTHRLQVFVLSTVTAEGPGSRLETSAQALARQIGTSGPPVTCGSSGQLEKEIATRVTRAVGG